MSHSLDPARVWLLARGPALSAVVRSTGVGRVPQWTQGSDRSGKRHSKWAQSFVGEVGWGQSREEWRELWEAGDLEAWRIKSKLRWERDELGAETLRGERVSQTQGAACVQAQKWRPYAFQGNWERQARKAKEVVRRGWRRGRSWATEDWKATWSGWNFSLKTIDKPLKGFSGVWHVQICVLEGGPFCFGVGNTVWLAIWWEP